MGDLTHLESQEGLPVEVAIELISGWWEGLFWAKRGGKSILS